ncbi:hypothetical protein BAL199_01344 [alpha proteobacterium BAL199]|nr:hypothetical protein BAL199_01344 [alpha proteobacterium BAL199]
MKPFPRQWQRLLSMMGSKRWSALSWMILGVRMRLAERQRK